ncbi:hypothetical protein, partial [Staphylococcus aureus]|uniref:hypothetical protein n=1 Tax=Staphylococcus aureus TaxID=1280 RepID=UPI000A7E0730
LGFIKLVLPLAQITVELVLVILSKLAQMSIVFSSPLWTPTIPPKTKIFIPVMTTHIIVVATLVAPTHLIAITFT